MLKCTGTTGTVAFGRGFRVRVAAVMVSKVRVKVRFSRSGSVGYSSNITHFTMSQADVVSPLPLPGPLEAARCYVPWKFTQK